MTTLIFLHGLNTLGTDDLRIGLLNYGLMHGPLERAFHDKKEINFVPITGAGRESPEAQAALALRFLQARGLPDDCVILGHSAGGLVARALAARPEMRGRVTKILTMGTPHRGAYVAEVGMNVDKHYPLLFHAMRLFGYDTRTKTEIIRNYTMAALDDFNRRFPPLEGTEEFTLLCEATRAELSWPYFIVYDPLHPRLDKKRPASDGFIYSESQKRGKIVGPFAIDHYGELGFFFQLNPFARKQAKAEFARLIDTICEIVRN